MFNKSININQKNLLLLLYVIILGVFGPAIYWISNARTGLLVTKDPKKDSVQTRISTGNRILVTADNNSAKSLGVEAFAAGDYITAEEGFSAALKMNRNDPEARIYLNNTLAAKTKNPYHVGVSVPIGGNLDVAKEILRGVAQAQDKINASGGINGKLMMVTIANDDNEPEIAEDIANKLVEDEKILAVIGHNDSNASIAAAPTYQENGVVMITPTSSAEVISKIGDYIFRATPSTRSLAETLAEYVVKVAGKESIAMCIDSASDVSVSFQENFTWAVYNHGGKINPLNCDLAAADFIASEIPSKAVSLGADALLLAPSVRQVEKTIEIISANKGRLTLLGNHSMVSYKTLKEGHKDAAGMVLTVAWYPDSDAAHDSFSHTARKLWGGGVNWRTAMAYDATQTLFKAITFGPERETIQQSLASPEFVARGSAASVNFLPSGDRNLQGTLVKIMPGKHSGTGFDFVTLDSEFNHQTIVDVDKAQAKKDRLSATTSPQ